ncbi:MAG: winged helix-turn-helix transcriptional regulator [Candidatus Lokiarchaeota archaeon]|nr:winged helix-turn-helix transcriptional regulator [Candidatus Lokiarchaeota archaeon]
MKKFIFKIIILFFVINSIHILNTYSEPHNINNLNFNSIEQSNLEIISEGFNNTIWNNGGSFYPDNAIDSFGNIHVVWEDLSDGEWGGGSDDPEIMYCNYTQGVGWSNATVISDGYQGFYWNNGDSLRPKIEIDINGNLHVVWLDATIGIWGGTISNSEIMYCNYTQGVGWSNATVISDGYQGFYWNNGQSSFPVIDSDSKGNIHVAWIENSYGIWGTDQEIMYCNYTQGVGWSNITVISDGYQGIYWNNDISRYPDMSIDINDNIHIVWNDGTDGIWGTDQEIMYCNYIQDVGWSNATVISDGFNNIYWNDDFSESPSIDTDLDGNVHVVWGDGTSGIWGVDEEIMYCNFIRGVGWSNATVISDGFNSVYWNNDTSAQADIFTDLDGNLHIVWEDWTAGQWGDDVEIWYIQHSQDNGWSNPIIISDGFEDEYWNSGISINPTISVGNNGTISIVWEDGTNGLWGTDTEIVSYNNIPNLQFFFQTNPKNDYFIYFLITILLLSLLSIIILSNKDKKKEEYEEYISFIQIKKNEMLCIAVAGTISIQQSIQIHINSNSIIDDSILDTFFIIFPYIILLICFLIIILIIYSIVISYEQYKTYLLHNNQDIDINRKLRLKDIFENQNRKRIIKIILNNPGIHYNALFKDSYLTPGQFQWHLRVLIEYKIIKRRKINNNTIFLPKVHPNNMKMKGNFKIIQSETIFKILDIIEINPGINQSNISKDLEMSKSLVNYYINKLKKKNLIKLTKSGRETQIFMDQSNRYEVYI